MDTKKLAERLKRIQEKASGGKNIWFKSTEEKKKIRQVPYPHEKDGSPFIDVYFHYSIAGNRSLVCPKETYGEPCPICELAEEFRNMGTKDSWTIFRKYSPKLRTYSPILIRGQEDLGIRLWGYGVTIYEELIEKYLSEDWGDLSDVKTGRDITVWSVLKGTPGNDSEYDKPKMDVSPKETVLLKKKADILTLLEDMPDYLNDGETFPVKSYQELQDIVRALSDEDEAEDDEDSTDVTYSDSSDTEDDDDDDADDLSSKLSKLLGDD